MTKSSPPVAPKAPVANSLAIVFDPIDEKLFDGTAKAWAVKLNEAKKESNKSTQLRRFYDEICMWAEKVGDKKEKYDELIPFIRMLNAKTAYAYGRKELVDKSFVELMDKCLKQVTDPKTLQRFKLFMEAIMGFYKEKRSN
ncbi:MAG: type III-A CRISPR-associated protein Csm2 [Magnetococcales bacterium]|nr:type III-A CRISPR-associated protein Csm2 [Magnetococcales bacterium]MBF0321538.1 type III-A CRISPR-associated protein Csm2 [Magnetococcales bacterium]MBF0321542.1 type III-A CRISPR-associated protein Csm2 [Magnetococcales bacterium]